MTILEDVHKILEYGDICDHCLGRLFAKKSFGLTNEQRGKALRTAHALEYNIPYQDYKKGTCWVCGDIFDDIPKWAEKCSEMVKDIEHETFVIGTRVPPMIAESEEMIWSDLSLESPEPLKSEMNREVGKAVSAINGKSGDPKNPQITIILNIDKDECELQISPIYFYGRYFKNVRGIPQTHWDCRACKGKGCEKCGYTGKQYPTSVEELIAEAPVKIFNAEKGVLHGAGREDIDALCIGTGRPFIMEIQNPKIRKYNLKELEKSINESANPRVGVKLEKWSDKKTVEKLKSHKGHKIYRILVSIDDSISVETVQKAVSSLNGAWIAQRTPNRVSHRRADLVRKRQVIGIRILDVIDGRYRIEVIGDGGLYIKELISGDEGRTVPSLAEILSKPAKVVELDVVNVEGLPENGD